MMKVFYGGVNLLQVFGNGAPEQLELLVAVGRAIPVEVHAGGVVELVAVHVLLPAGDEVGVSEVLPRDGVGVALREGEVRRLLVGVLRLGAAVV